MKEKKVTSGLNTNLGSFLPFVMRNLTPGPKFSLLAAAVILITLAVSSIGYAKAEETSFEANQKGSLDQGDAAAKAKRSLKYKDSAFGEHSLDHGADKSGFYKKWEAGGDLSDDDVQYSSQSDLMGSDGAGADGSYESDGYGYDDDEYDHLNYKRYDSDKEKANQDTKLKKDVNTMDKSGVGMMNDPKVAVPEATTIELLSFQTKNLSPGSESMQGKEDPKLKTLAMKKQFAGKANENEKDLLVDEKLKKKTPNEQKADELKSQGSPGNDKNTGNVKVTESKVSESKSNVESKSEKAKVSDAGSSSQVGMQNLKESVQVAESKQNAASGGKADEDLSKNEAKLAEKDVKGGDVKYQSEGKEEKDSEKVKEEKDLEVGLDESKAAADGGKERNLSQFSSADYKDGLDEGGIADDEKGSEDMKDDGMTLAGLRDSRNDDMLYQYADPTFRYSPGKYIRKKDAFDGFARRKVGSRSSLGKNWDGGILGKEDAAQGSFERGPKEPFHLDFPLADLENTDYHRNFMKSLKRFKGGLEESSRILSQGDTPSPYADEAKQQLASRVIEEEQRKRRSRLRRLKASPMFGSIRKRDREDLEDLYGYGPGARGRLQYGQPFGEANMRYNPLRGEGMYHGMPGYDGMGFIPAMGGQRRGFAEDEEESDMLEPLDEDEELSRKNKRQDSDPGEFLEEEEDDDGYSESGGYLTKRKSQAKSSWTSNDYATGQKKKLKEAGLYEDPNRHNTPLVLLQRGNNGQQSMKTFVDGTNKNVDGIDSEDLARLLSRDSNYVVLKRVPGKDQVQKVYDQGQGSRTSEISRGKSAGVGEANKKDKYKFSQMDVMMKGQRPAGSEDPDLRKVVGTYKESRVEQPSKKDDHVKDLSDFFKGDAREADEKKEMLISIDRHLSQLQRGEPNKKIMYKPPLSQAYRHMKEFEGPDRLSDVDSEQRELYASSGKKSDKNAQAQAFADSDRMIKSFKKEGKEVLIMNRPFNGVAFKAKTQETVMQNLNGLAGQAQGAALGGGVPGMAQASAGNVPVGGSPIASSLQQPANVVPNANAMLNMPMSANSMLNMAQTNAMLNMPQPNANQNANQNSMMQQIKLPDSGQKSADASRKYYLFGPENDMASAPKHEIKVMQSDFSIPQDSPYNAQNYNPQSYSQQNYNNQNYNYNSANYNKVPGAQMKAPQNGKAVPVDKGLNVKATEGQAAYAAQQQHQQQQYDYLNAQQCMAVTNQPATSAAAQAAATADKMPSGVQENYKKLSKKDDDASGDLKRFMRDFQDFSVGSNAQEIPYKTEKLAGMSLQELTSHGDKHLQKLNNLLKEIISNKVEVSNSEARKNVKRGMFQKQTNWQPAGGESQTDSQVRSGKWTSVVYDGSSANQLDFMDKNDNLSPGESLFKEETKYRSAGESSKSSGKEAAASADKLNAARSTKDAPGADHSKRSKRQAPYDSKDSTKALEVKVKSTPYQVEPQPLNPPGANSNSAQQSQQQKSGARACLELPPEKLLDLMNFFDSEHYDYQHKEVPKARRSSGEEGKSCQCGMRPTRETDEEDEKTESIRRSFEGYLDPLARKIAEYENRSGERSRRKREIELDESMPNDFQNFLVTSLGGFGNQKREVVKKDEALWEASEGSRDEASQMLMDGAGNREPSEYSSVGKRDTSRSGKSYRKSDAEERRASLGRESDATNIRIRIVDGNGNGGLIGKGGSEAGIAESRFGAGKEDERGGLAAAKGDAEDRRTGPSIHEVYLITNTDAKKRKKKKKFATPRSDQTTQKQPISNHLPQVETVYNPSPGSNKAQIEKINSNEAGIKAKCVANPQNVYNATASMMEDNIIRNNLRTGNINTFTYQKKEEPTPYPLQRPTNPPTSGEFEMLDSKNPSKPKSYNSRGSFVPYGSATFANSPEIVYKDESPQRYANAAPNTKQIPVIRSFQPGMGDEFRRFSNSRMYKTADPDPYQKDYAEEDPAYAEYEAEEADSFAEGQLNRQADAEYDLREIADENERESPLKFVGGHRQEENLNPKMVEMWNNYARTHLSPDSHREAMNREFQEAYLRSGFGSRLAGRYAGDVPRRFGPGRQFGGDNFGANFMRNLNQQEYERLAKAEGGYRGEKLSKRLSNTRKRGGPIQIGRRFFYTFKTEVPDEEFYTLYQEPMKIRIVGDNKEAKKPEDVQLISRQQSDRMGQTVMQDDDSNVLENVIGSYIVRKSANENGNIGENWKKLGTRRKRSAEETSEGQGEETGAEDESKTTEKRLSSGHLTENHYRKYHRKNFNLKRDVEEEPKEEDNSPISEEDGCRVKRDALADVVKADMQRRINEEKKARNMVKNLKVELTKSDIPFIGAGLMPQEDILPPGAMQHLEDERKKNKVAEENPYKDDQQQQQQQHSSNMKGGTPDVFKTFEIKRGRRQGSGQTRKRTPAGGKQHSIVSRSEPELYQDTVFLKGKRARKARKFSEEGFEPITRDLRFSDKSTFEGKSAAAEERRSATVVNRKADSSKATKATKAKDVAGTAAVSGSSNSAKQTTHGVSHEAPLLTQPNPLNSPKIFDALKQIPLAPSKGESKAQEKEPSGESVLASLEALAASGRAQVIQTSDRSSSKIQDSEKSEPLLGAVLVLTKRDKNKRDAVAADRRRSRGSNPSALDWAEVRQQRFGRETGAAPRVHLRSHLEKRSADSSSGAEEVDRDDAEEANHKDHGERSPGIVNEDGAGRSSGVECETKTCNLKKTNNFKQSSFPFSQYHNIDSETRNGGESGPGDSGEDVLESILGRVESNPHFRKVIGPGLRWRGRKCYSGVEDRHRCFCPPPNRSQFVRQVRKILAKFVSDIEKLAAQDVTRSPCYKLDGRSNRFLHELLEVPFEPSNSGMPASCEVELKPFLRGRCSGKPESGFPTAGNDASSTDASTEAIENRRRLVLKLLGEYQSLSEPDKKSVEILGQYLVHELGVLNRALNIQDEDRAKDVNSQLPAGTTAADEKKCEERSTSAATPATEASTEPATATTEAALTTEKDFKRGSVKIPFIWSNPEDMRYVRPGVQTPASYPSSDLQPGKVLGAAANLPRTDSVLGDAATENPLASLPNAAFPRFDAFTGSPDAGYPGAKGKFRLKFGDEAPGKSGGELHKLGYGDAAGLQLSLKSHGPWVSNLNLKRGKPVDLWTQGKQSVRLPGSFSRGRSDRFAVADLPPFPSDDSAEQPQLTDRRDPVDPDSEYDLDYQDYYDDDAYQMPNYRGVDAG